MANLNYLDKINDIITLFTFVISIILCLALFFRFKLKIDIPAIVILLTYNIVNALRIFISEEMYSGLDYAQPFGNMIIWIILIFFVFEMSYIRAIISINDIKIYKREKKKITKARIIIFAIFIILYVPTNLYVFKTT
jgi:hypothetical protein